MSIVFIAKPIRLAGPNRLLARLATTKGKPNGQFEVGTTQLIVKDIHNEQVREANGGNLGHRRPLSSQLARPSTMKNNEGEPSQLSKSSLSSSDQLSLHSRVEQAHRDAVRFLESFRVSDLPGVGWATAHKLSEAGIGSVVGLRTWSREKLLETFGKKLGTLLFETSRGVDDRPKIPPVLQPDQGGENKETSLAEDREETGIYFHKERKSIGAEVNWGLRFENDEEVKSFLLSLSKEVVGRMAAAAVKGKTVTIKVDKLCQLPTIRLY